MSALVRKVAVIDIGKTHAKLIVVDGTNGEELASRKIANRVLSSPPYPHYDIDALWDFILEGLAAFSQEPGYQAISITTHGASAALLNAAGELAMPVLDYEHQYPLDIQKSYAGLRPEFFETYSPALPMGLNLGAQLHYQKNAFPDAFARTSTILTYPQYWAYRLTGVAANEVTSLGCHTDLWRPETNEFSSLIDKLEIRQMMAPVRSAFDMLGPVLPDTARKIGAGADMPVYCGLHDSNASLLPHLMVREEPFSVVSTGTWVICFGVGAPLGTLDPARDSLVNVDAFGKPVPSARFMGGREFEIMAAKLGHLPEPDTLKAAVDTAVNKGIMLLPNIVTGSGPFPGLQSSWLASENATTAEKHAAVLLYLALMTDACLGVIGATGPVIVEGPFASNTIFLSLLSAIVQRETIAVSGSTGTSRGAALLASSINPYAYSESSVSSWENGKLSSYKETWRNTLEN